MAEHLNFQDHCRASQRRYDLNIDAIIQKYEGTFEDSDIIDLRDFSIVKDHGSLHRTSPKPFGYTNLAATDVYSDSDVTSIVSSDFPSSLQQKSTGRRYNKADSTVTSGFLADTDSTRHQASKLTDNNDTYGIFNKHQRSRFTTESSSDSDSNSHRHPGSEFSGKGERRFKRRFTNDSDSYSNSHRNPGSKFTDERDAHNHKDDDCSVYSLPSSVNTDSSFQIDRHIDRIRQSCNNETFIKHNSHEDTLYEDFENDDRFKESYQSILTYLGSDEPSDGETITSDIDDVPWEDVTEGRESTDDTGIFYLSDEDYDVVDGDRTLHTNIYDKTEKTFVFSPEGKDNQFSEKFRNIVQNRSKENQETKRRIFPQHLGNVCEIKTVGTFEEKQILVKDNDGHSHKKYEKSSSSGQLHSRYAKPKGANTEQYVNDAYRQKKRSKFTTNGSRMLDTGSVKRADSDCLFELKSPERQLKSLSSTEYDKSSCVTIKESYKDSGISSMSVSQGPDTSFGDGTAYMQWDSYMPSANYEKNATYEENDMEPRSARYQMQLSHNRHDLPCRTTVNREQYTHTNKGLTHLKTKTGKIGHILEQKQCLASRGLQGPVENSSDTCQRIDEVQGSQANVNVKKHYGALPDEENSDWFKVRKAQKLKLHNIRRTNLSRHLNVENQQEKGRRNVNSVESSAVCKAELYAGKPKIAEILKSIVEDVDRNVFTNRRRIGGTDLACKYYRKKQAYSSQEQLSGDVEISKDQSDEKDHMCIDSVTSEDSYECKSQDNMFSPHYNRHSNTKENLACSKSMPPKIIHGLKQGMLERNLDQKQLSSYEKVYKWLSPQTEQSLVSPRHKKRAKRRLHLDLMTGLTVQSVLTVENTDTSNDVSLQKDKRNQNACQKHMTPKSTIHPYAQGLRKEDSPSTALSKLKLFSPSSSRRALDMTRVDNSTDTNSKLLSDSGQLKSPSFKMAPVSSRVKKDFQTSTYEMEYDQSDCIQSSPWRKLDNIRKLPHRNLSIQRNSEGMIVLAAMTESGLSDQVTDFISATNYTYNVDRSMSKVSGKNQAEINNNRTSCLQGVGTLNVIERNEDTFSQSSIELEKPSLKNSKTADICVKDARFISSKNHSKPVDSKPELCVTSPARWHTSNSTKPKFPKDSPGQLSNQMALSPMVTISASPKVKPVFENLSYDQNLERDNASMFKLPLSADKQSYMRPTSRYYERHPYNKKYSAKDINDNKMRRVTDDTHKSLQKQDQVSQCVKKACENVERSSHVNRSTKCKSNVLCKKQTDTNTNHSSVSSLQNAGRVNVGQGIKTTVSHGNIEIQKTRQKESRTVNLNVKDNGFVSCSNQQSKPIDYKPEHCVTSPLRWHMSKSPKSKIRKDSPGKLSNRMAMSPMVTISSSPKVKPAFDLSKNSYDDMASGKYNDGVFKLPVTGNKQSYTRPKGLAPVTTTTYETPSFDKKHNVQVVNEMRHAAGDTCKSLQKQDKESQIVKKHYAKQSRPTASHIKHNTNHKAARNVLQDRTVPFYVHSTPLKPFSRSDEFDLNESVSTINKFDSDVDSEGEETILTLSP